MFKQLRNDILLRFYLVRRPENFTSFLHGVSSLSDKNILIVVAFEQPWALNWLLKMAKKNIEDAHVLVFDNSKNLSMRPQIEKVCKDNQVSYLGLPVYRTKHVNRSHGMAMSWIYKNVVTEIKPKIFGFIDHDLVPISLVNISACLKAQPFFGRLGGSKPNYWSLWAGFCIFDFEFLRKKEVNFLYDFSRGLDTGGKNWSSLYSSFDRTALNFAQRDYKKLYLPSLADGVTVEFIDERWVHIGSISYNDGFRSKFNFFDVLAKELAEDADWTKFLQHEN